jgi:DMSO/TMAO reductase YedYZ molybdopterin-dependent catalytic subunit
MRRRSPSTLDEGDQRALLREAALLLPDPARRRLLRGAITVGGLAMATGCSVTDSDSAQTLLTRMSRFNDRVQGWLFDPNKLAPEYTRAEITQPFPFNAYYGESEVREVNGDTWRLAVSGRVAKPRNLTLEDLRAMPQRDQITHHICVEGWSAIGRWGGPLLADVLLAVGADTSARYVAFKCADDYHTSIDMATALHQQTFVALTYDGQTLPAKYGFPAKVRMPTKLGYKNPKHVMELVVTNEYPGGYWEDQGYNWFGGS